MKVFVTGNAGYIGSHITRALLNEGYEVWGYDDLSTGKESLFDVDCNQITGSILNQAYLTMCMKSIRPDVVMHLAAKSIVSDSNLDPASYYETNVQGTINVMRSMHAANAPRIVFSSSAAVYGNAEPRLITEDTPTYPINVYGATKLYAESVISDMCHAHGMTGFALRYFNAAGASPDGGFGESRDPETHLIPLAIRAAIRGTPLKLFGSEFNTKDGTAVRDYVHVDDIALAHILAMNASVVREGGDCHRFNLGSETGYSVLEVVRTVEAVSGKKIALDIQPPRTGDPSRLVASATGAKALLGWEPKYNTLESIVKTAYNWHIKEVL